MDRVSNKQILDYVLKGFAITMLSIALMNSLIYLLFGSPYLAKIFPHWFLGRGFEIPEILKYFYELNYAGGKYFQRFVSEIVNDPFKIASKVIYGPVVEEIIFRLPLLYLWRYIRSDAWCVSAFVLTVIFTLGHPLGLGYLIPIFTMGIICCWLIVKTNKFWPCILVHFIYNSYCALSEIGKSVLHFGS